MDRLARHEQASTRVSDLRGIEVLGRRSIDSDQAGDARRARALASRPRRSPRSVHGTKQLAAMRDAPQEWRGEDVSVAQTLVNASVFSWSQPRALPLVRARAGSRARCARGRRRSRAGLARHDQRHRRIAEVRGPRIEPQVGLVPLSADLASGLWGSRSERPGDAASRRADSRARLDDTCGLVLVLLPGGTFHQGVPVDEGVRRVDPHSVGHERGDAT